MMKEMRIGVAIFGLLIFLVSSNELAGAKDPEFPTKPINFYISYSAGGATDLGCRKLFDPASKRLGQPIIPINKPGAGGTLAATAVINAKPDGYTLGSIETSNAFMAPFAAESPYKDLNGFTMIMNFGAYVRPLMVRGDAPWRTWRDFIEWTRKNPKAAKIGIAGGKTVDIKGIALWQVEKREQVEFTYIPFKGSPEVLTATLGGHITIYGTTADPSTMPYLKDGKLRILLYMSNEKIPGYENIPSIEELYGFAIPNLLGIAGPKGLPEYVVKKLHDTFSESIKDSGFVSFMNQMCTPIAYMNRDQMKSYVEKTFLQMSEVIKKLKAEEAKGK